MTGLTRARRTISRLAFLAVLVSGTQARGQDEGAVFGAASRVLRFSCALPGCHAGPDAAKGLRLEPGWIYRTTVNVPARTDPALLRVSPGAPERSLLYLKLLAPEEGHYRGPRMPLSMPPLGELEMSLVREWIASFPAERWGAPEETEPIPVPPRHFHDSHLANLPTADPLGSGTLQFRVLHRFRPAAEAAGSEDLYGLDGGAWISLALAYGLAEKLDVGLRRSGLQKDWEGYGKVLLLKQGEQGPLSVAFQGGYASIRDEAFANRSRWHAQVVASRRMGKRLSLMVVPTYVTRTNFMEEADDSGTTAVGAGAEFRLRPNLAITGEWVGQSGGVKAPFPSGALGLSIATSRHAFHLLLSNTQGTHTDLYAPGGDLDWRGGEFRLGFNITRTYGLR